METVLVVDDEKVIRDGCNRVLVAEGYKVLMASNGREALDVLSSEPPDVVLCDLVMPVMGGFELLEQIQALHPDLPLIVLTGHGTVANAVEAMKKGAYDFITKPFRVEHLVLIIRRALEKRTLERCARELQRLQSRNLYDLAMEKGRLGTIMSCMADGVLVTNRSLEVVLQNPALSGLLGVPPVSEPVALAECFPDAELIEGLRALMQTRDKGGLLSRDFCKGDRHLHSVSAPVPGLCGEILGTVTVFQDVTAFKELDELKSNFVQMVSHELRSPLSAIKQILAVILEGMAGELNEKQRELLDRSQVRIQGLLDLINDLLNLARIESRCTFEHQAALNLREVLERVVGLMRPRAESNRIEMKMEIAEELPSIQADPRSMEELFSNLIGNAINYSPNGGEVVVSAFHRGNCIEASVRDTGLGMSREEIPKIFEKFYRIRDPEAREVIGTGLGLAIVKGIIESHKGHIEVESQPGKGSCFRVLLPIFPQS